MNNEKAEKAKQGGEKFKIRKPQSAKGFMKLVCKIHVVARKKSPQS